MTSALFSALNSTLNHVLNNVLNNARLILYDADQLYYA